MEKQKNIPQLRFPDFEGEWVLKTIEELFEFKNGLNKEKEYFGKGTPIINFKDVFSFPDLNKENILGLVEVSKKEAINFNVKKGDVFFTRTSEIIEEIGIAATLTEDIENCVFSGFVLRARPKNNELDDFYKKYCFATRSVRKEIITKSSYTTRALTSGTILNKVIILYPRELDEQQKIASFFTAIDQKISQLKKKKILLEQYKKGVMQKIFSQEIRFKDDNGKEFPKWKLISLGELMSIPSKNKASKVDKGKLLTVRLHVKGVHINENTESLKIGATTYFIRKKGQFIYGKQNLFNGAFGIIPDEYDNYLSSGDIPALDINFNLLNPCFLFFFFSREVFYKKLEDISSGSGSKRIHEDTLLKIKLKLPTLSEQTKIANFFSALDDKINHTQKQIEKAEVWKKGLMQQMFV